MHRCLHRRDAVALLISCQHVSKSYGARPLFQRVSLGIADDDRLGLIGPNGAGKSTLLKILAGIETPDTGDIAVSRQARIGYVAQEESFPAGHTIREVLRAALDDHPLEAYEKDTQVAILLGKVGFTDPDRRVEHVSGGVRKRLAIACQLIRQPDLLLLDEPTNHLDVEGILWLEQLLRAAPFAYVAVSHDRYFLQRISRRVIELNAQYPEGHFSAVGTYGDFLEARATFLAGQQQYEAVLANRVRREIEWLRRGPKARTTKAHGRIEAAHALMEDLGDVQYRNAQTARAQIDFTASERRTKKFLQAVNVAKTMGGRRLFDNLTLTLSPGMKLGVLGMNGSGKSTLLKVLTGVLSPDAGTMEHAAQLRVVYFDQHREQLDDAQTLKAALAPHGDQVIYRDRPVHVVTWAKRFLFRPEQLNLCVRELSGGERARIVLARFMRESADLLILDEPTNDLDIPTLEILEESLEEFPGAIVLVTHDRCMLDRVATQLLALDGAGTATMYADYAQWEAAQQARCMAPADAAPEKTAKKNVSAVPAKKLSYREQREYDGMEEAILHAEAEVARWTQTLKDPAISTDAAQLQTACVALQTAQRAVETLYARWTELEAKRVAGTVKPAPQPVDKNS
ncbi:MAG: ABC-F family ATP-binding cassette domain-containing protein [Deltaproteobacteria bacterium]|nr:ABC-F family ATP-binding cassette domain-containing protein [Deltaproteobacteria bacterium]